MLRQGGAWKVVAQALMDSSVEIVSTQLITLIIQGSHKLLNHGQPGKSR